MIGMLTCVQEVILHEVLKWNNAEDAISFLLRKYSEQSADNAKFLLNAIPQVAELALERSRVVAVENANAAFWLICQRGMKVDNDGMYFASMVPVCKALFPEGKRKGCSKAESDYFDLFVKQFKNPNVFSWEKDKAWADSLGYTEYLKIIEKQLEE